VSYYVSFSVEGQEEPVDGDEIASARGWATFAGWAAALPDPPFHELSYLAEEGWCEEMSALERELQQALAERPGTPSPDVLEVGRRLLAEVRGRPTGADAMVVTDGTAGEGD
jgi:hypothetical protein